ncbi:bifunctional [glutamine synthetase] adenylyltransferase/[glutamine synthetase]-adenylyl-L-tyrosine phosphorylase [Methylocystis heyeri]|uniref:Bifunctional glutamine synthetase adenylyltransferase/adenylyl-removing enzyme n=1 Tax=Methylocystis heyeri TaxID=391905 RepID=A0A6B8KHX3_9HYPH|nr:bifunctional [glutamine synthetase] adenylyltransferase/[glutamine synthetase]-adenylyl-L-tyrosine phosphorylase [Methylocystis heyeri]QGM47209.1 bifunctional [glutamine synthetase] adenylyltransferase/[glutamine synthetase]-adenylyl-L-tyrosine phosphorylase [Methylocystis heyeri]
MPSTENSLLSRARLFIRPADPEAAERSLNRALERDQDAALAALLASEPKARELLIGVFGCSPYLAGLAAQNPARLVQLLAGDPEAAVSRLIDHAKNMGAPDEAELMRSLRLVKQEAALVVALADLSKAWDTMTATRALTLIADATLSAAVSFTLREAAQAGRLALAHPGDPERESGWIFLGMGKQGAYELNYSSDIDLVVLFDRRRARVAKPGEEVDLFVRLTKRIIRIMSEQTADGYVFRTDLRLRPDPGATPIAIPLEAAFSYYESMGQNWERAAFIKARPVAGDIAAGEEFLKELQPFVWRKYFDFAAIADVHSIKRQIHAHKGHGEIAVNGHNIKLGRGGIREIEFFVQTQQLITGGRDPSLRGRATLDMLVALAERGWIEGAARDALEEAYVFLRDVEHRIQMVADEQSHSLPQSEEGVARIAMMMGFEGARDFAAALLRRLETVQDCYARLFESAPQLSSGAGNLVFTGDEDDPATLATLEKLGFAEPRTVTAIIRSWHFGRYPATRSAVARERLTELTPALLEALAATDNADRAMLAFDKFVSRLPAGVQLFSLLASHPNLLHLLTEIMGAAPELAAAISRRPRVLGALLEPSFFNQPAEWAELEDRLKIQMAEAGSFEDALDRARIFGQEQKFLIGARIITEALSPRDAGFAYARLAEILIGGLLDVVEAEFARAHGRVPGGEAAVVALGKLGGREMTAASDLDLMLIYDADPMVDSEGGERPLPSPQYYARLTQRLIMALSAPTAEGLLYDVDFRLRPSGNKGPIAVRLKAFEEYQKNEAWSWERMALTRARVVAGTPHFAARVAAAIREALVAPRDMEKLRADVAEMRRLVEKEKGSNNPFDLKQVPGGQIDIEFATQYLLLRHAATHPECLSTSVEEALRQLRDKELIERPAAEALIEAYRTYQGLMQVLRLAIAGDFAPEKASRGLANLLLRAADAPDLERLEARLRETEAGVREAFMRIVGI